MSGVHPLLAFARVLASATQGTIIPGTIKGVLAGEVVVVNTIGERIIRGMEDAARLASAPERAELEPLDPAAGDAVRAERGAAYGSFESTLTEFGITVGSLLRQAFPQFNGMEGKPRLPDLPPHVAGWVMVALKSHRAVAPFRYDVDDYSDAFNYMRAASQVDPMRVSALLEMGSAGEASTETAETRTE